MKTESEIAYDKGYADGYEAASKKKVAFDPKTIGLPSWIPLEAWVAWCDDRKERRKPITKRGAAMQLVQLSKFRAEGHAPQAVISHSIAGGYQGLFAPPASGLKNPAWRIEQRERTQLAAPGVAVQNIRANDFFEAAEPVRRLK